MLVVRKQPQLLGLPLAVVRHARPVPPPLLIVVQFAQVGHDMLPRPGLGANALDQRVVRDRERILTPLCPCR